MFDFGRRKAFRVPKPCVSKHRRDRILEVIAGAGYTVGKVIPFKGYEIISGSVYVVISVKGMKNLSDAAIVKAVTAKFDSCKDSV